jgi:hypothetical protein
VDPLTISALAGVVGNIGGSIFGSAAAKDAQQAQEREQQAALNAQLAAQRNSNELAYAMQKQSAERAAKLYTPTNIALAVLGVILLLVVLFKFVF